MIPQGPDDQAWIGLTDDLPYSAVKMEFLWTDSSEVDFFNWNDGEPADSEERCGRMYGAGMGGLGGIPCCICFLSFSKCVDMHMILLEGSKGMLTSCRHVYAIVSVLCFLHFIAPPPPLLPHGLGKWNNDLCTKTAPYVCQIHAPATPPPSPGPEACPGAQRTGTFDYLPNCPDDFSTPMPDSTLNEL